VKKINIKDASIATATIEIQHLIVSDRKLTMAVFRQIPEEVVVDFEKGTLRGEVWGHVNYWWGNDDPSPDARHLVWQKGSGLRRFKLLGTNPYNSKINTGRFRHMVRMKRDIVESLQEKNLQIEALESYLSGPDEYSGCGKRENLAHWITGGYDKPFKELMRHLDNLYFSFGDPSLEKERRDNAHVAVVAVIDSIRAEIDTIPDPAPLSEEIEVIWGRWLKLCDELQKTPQLFIAV